MTKKYLILKDSTLAPIELHEEDFDEFGYIKKKFFDSEEMRNLVLQYESGKEEIKVHSFYSGYDKCYYSTVITTSTTTAKFEVVEL